MVPEVRDSQYSIYCPLDPLSCFKTKPYRFLTSSGANINFTPVVARLYTFHTVTKEWLERVVGSMELSSESLERFSLPARFGKTEESQPEQARVLCRPSQDRRGGFLRPLNGGVKTRSTHEGLLAVLSICRMSDEKQSQKPYILQIEITVR